MEATNSEFAGREDRECKESAVAPVCGGKTLADVARHLGVSHGLRSRWVERAQSGRGQTQVGTLDRETSQERQMRRIRHRIDHLRRRDIFKKSRGIDSAPPRPCD